jgi:hypothetical protein
VSVDTLAVWFFAATWVLVAILIAGVLMSAAREAVRIVKRVLALVNDSPLPLQLAKAEADAARISRALDRIPALVRRADDAAEVIRATPLIPPALVELFARIRREYAAFRAAVR